MNELSKQLNQGRRIPLGPRLAAPFHGPLRPLEAKRKAPLHTPGRHKSSPKHGTANDIQDAVPLT